jgi:hypothetical protein
VGRSFLKPQPIPKASARQFMLLKDIKPGSTQHTEWNFLWPQWRAPYDKFYMRHLDPIYTYIATADLRSRRLIRAPSITSVEQRTNKWASSSHNCVGLGSTTFERYTTATVTQKNGKNDKTIALLTSATL